MRARTKRSNRRTMRTIRIIRIRHIRRRGGIRRRLRRGLRRT